MDAIETKKAIAIYTEIDRLKDVMSDSIKSMLDNEMKLKRLLVFCYDDYLTGQRFVSKATLDYMVKEYGEKLATLLEVVDKLKGLEQIRNDRLDVFRSNLDAFAISQGIDITENKGLF